MLEEKNAFLTVINKTADVYDKKIQRERVSVYWDALKHRDLTDIKTALNRHIQDADRGRFFPLPADVAAQLPKELDPWLSANEAWAACPKSESDSAALCHEISSALCVAQDLMDMGDMIAARMAFIEHYNRLVESAKSIGEKPKWFPSYGFDKETRYLADRKVVEYRNLALPSGQKLALPEPEEDVDPVQALEQKGNPAKISEFMNEIKKKLEKAPN